MLTQQELKNFLLNKISTLTSMDVNDIDLAVTFDQIGLDSLSLAVMFIELEEISGVDPFGEGRALLSDIRSINDIIDIYVINQVAESR